MRISAIVAIDNKRGMGKEGGIPWHIPGEQKRFKEITTPHPMIMGRKTFESIGRILPNRLHIIVTRDTAYTLPGALVVHSLLEAIETAKEAEYKRMDTITSHEASNLSTKISHNAREEYTPEVFIIGGGEIFREAMPHTNRLYLTIIDNDFHCDTFFPDYADFTKIIDTEEKTDWDYLYRYITLDK